MSQLRWAGLVEKMGEERMAKRADAQRLEGKGGEEELDCDGKTGKRDFEGLGERWKTRANDLVERAVQDQGEKFKKIRQRASESRPVSPLTSPRIYEEFIFMFVESLNVDIWGVQIEVFEEPEDGAILASLNGCANCDVGEP